MCLVFNILFFKPCKNGENGCLFPVFSAYLWLKLQKIILKFANNKKFCYLCREMDKAANERNK